jgi:hypothetical protein
MGHSTSKKSEAFDQANAIEEISILHTYVMRSRESSDSGDGSSNDAL